MTRQVSKRDWAGFAKHAAPEAIAARLAAATTAHVQAGREVAELRDLLAERQRQVAAGEWPPEPKTQVLSVRFADDELAELDAWALARGLTRTQALRGLISGLLAATQEDQT